MYEYNKIYHGDCLEIMDNLIKDGVKVDCIITDLPYGVLNKTKTQWDNPIPFEPMWEKIDHLIKENGAVVLFGTEPFSSALRMSNLKDYKYEWIWEKSNPSNIGNANRQPLKYHENISVFYKKQCTYNKQMIVRESPRIKQAHKNNYTFHNSMSEQNALDYIEVSSSKYDANFKNPSSILKINSLRPNSKEFVKHPTQKPLELMKNLVLTYTNENEVVLDFTCGSGSTLCACIETNRQYIGIEKDEQYYDISVNRVNGYIHME